MANLKRAEYGKVDLDYVLGIGGFDLERFLSFIFVYCREHIEWVCVSAARYQSFTLGGKR
jgi:hypothetical protein